MPGKPKWGYKGVTKLKKKTETPFRCVIKLAGGGNKAFSNFSSAPAASKYREEWIASNRSLVHESQGGNPPKKAAKKKPASEKKTPSNKKTAPRRSTRKKTPANKAAAKKKTPKKRAAPKKKAAAKKKTPKKRAAPKKKATPKRRVVKRKSPKKKASKKKSVKKVAKENRLPGTTMLRNGKWRGYLTLKNGKKKTFGLFDNMKAAYDAKESWKRNNKSKVKK